MAATTSSRRAEGQRQPAPWSIVEIVFAGAHGCSDWKESKNYTVVAYTNYKEKVRAYTTALVIVWPIAPAIAFLKFAWVTAQPLEQMLSQL